MDRAAVRDDLGSANDRYAPNLVTTRDGRVSALSSAARAQISYSTTIASVDDSPEGSTAPRDGVRSTCDSGRRTTGVPRSTSTRASAGEHLTTDGNSGVASRSTSASRPATHRD